MPPVLLRCISKKGSNRRQLARCGRRAQPLAPASRQECPQIDRGKLGQLGAANGLAKVHGEEVDQSPRTADIGANGVGRSAAVMPEMIGPARNERASAAGV
jgi:hypothetical protein